MLQCPDLSALFPSRLKDIYPELGMTSLKEITSSPVNPYPCPGDKPPAPLPKEEQLCKATQASGLPLESAASLL